MDVLHRSAEWSSYLFIERVPEEDREVFRPRHIPSLQVELPDPDPGGGERGGRPFVCLPDEPLCLLPSRNVPDVDDGTRNRAIRGPHRADRIRDPAGRSRAPAWK